MATFDELKARYMYAGASPAVTTFAGSKVVPLIYDGSRRKEYFAALRDAINRAGVQFIGIAGWWLDSNFSLDGAGGTTLATLLKARSAAGVDVRVLGWVMPPEVLRNPQIQKYGSSNSIFTLNGDTMAFINTLRAEPTLREKAVLNIISHPAGAVHTKMSIVAGPDWSVAFTGGLDLQNYRHFNWWFDVQAQVTGPAVQPIYDFYRQMWNEVQSRPPATALNAITRAGSAVTCDSHSAAMPTLPTRAMAGTGDRMHVQSARTIPQFNLAAKSGSMTLPSNQPLSFAPTGLFEVKAVWQQALEAARDYIYVEDQSFTSPDIFISMNKALKASPTLKVIMVIGANDPTAPNPDVSAKAMRVFINTKLLDGLNAAQVSRVGFFAYVPVGNSDPRFRFVHTKSTIVDDNWAIIGSANHMTRSLFTDIEHSVAFMDEAGLGVPAYRVKLWQEHLGANVPDMATAIARWFAVPFRGSGTANPLNFDRIPLFPIGIALQGTSLTSDEQMENDELADVDSRRTWGANIVKVYMQKAGVGSLGVFGGGGSAADGGKS